jgi:Mlc titration factor MtfA (ptsG expression regulator)
VLFVLQESCAPDVWLQLLLRCATESECKQEVLRAIAHELTEHESLTLQQQQQLSAQQQQLLAQEQLVAAQQRQITGLQEQLSAQQLAASVQMAGLRGQLQGLHEAVQQLLSHHR